MRYRAVTFDVGGTLIEPFPSVGEVYAAVAAELHVRGADAVRLQTQFSAAWNLRQAFDHSPAAWRKIVAETFAGISDPDVSSFDQLYSRIYARFAEAGSWRVFEDVIPTLSRLREEGVTLGIISNWDERLRPLLDQLCLSQFFPVMIVSREVGWQKPDPRVFEYAARALELPPRMILHTGDHLVEDLAGARAAGMESVLIWRRARAVRPEGAISSLMELG